MTVEFEPDADYYRSRQFVAERVAQAVPQLPPGTEPPLLSSLTGRLNEIFEFTLEAEPGAADLMTLRDLAEFEVKNRLLAVPGVAAVERLGGYLRQFQVQLDPERMSARGVTLDEVMHAVEARTSTPPAASSCRGRWSGPCARVGRARTASTTCAAPWSSCAATTPVLLGDVADVREAPAVRRGIAHRLKGEVVSAAIVKQFGADTVKVAAGIRRAIAEIQRALPQGRRSCASSTTSRRWSRSALGGVGRAVLLGARVRRAGAVRAARRRARRADRHADDPAVDRAGGCCSSRSDVGINTMTLGGLAIAVGLLVDAAIIVTENIVHRLTRRTRRDAPRARRCARRDRGRPADRVRDADRHRGVPAAVRHDAASRGACTSRWRRR